MPTFGDPADERACGVLANKGGGGLEAPAALGLWDLWADEDGLFPDRELMTVPSRAIILAGGNVHGVTQQPPRAVAASGG